MSLEFPPPHELWCLQEIKNLATEIKELENVEDLFTNIGDTLGPVLGGYAAQFLTVSHAFIAIGIFGVLAAGILLLYIPNNLVVHV